MRIKICAIFLCLWGVLVSHYGYATSYIPTDQSAEIESVDITDAVAVIKMKNYSVKVPLEIMKGTDYKRAHGITPEGMAIGLKYNDTILRLIAIDKAKENYMAVDLLAKGASDFSIPDDYLEPIDPKGIYVSAVQFIQSYPLWPANNVARGFDLLSSKEKAIIFLFPSVTLEIADKLCRADRVTSGVFEVLSHQKRIKDCDGISFFDDLKNLKDLQNNANQERDLLIQALECTQGLRKPTHCHNVNKKLSKKILYP